MAKLTAKAVENIKAGTVRLEVSDDLIPSLRVIVSPSGAKSWALRVRIGGKPAKLTLGSVEVHDLKTAREWARASLIAVKAGVDPRTERRDREEAERAKHASTVQAAVDLWLAKDQAANRTAGEVRSTMAKWVLPAWRDRPLSSLRKRDVIVLIDNVAETAPVRANRVLAYCKRFLGWCAARDLIEVNPAASVEKVAKENKRDRVLDDRELVSIWRAAEALGGIYGSAIRVLILTGCRRAEVFEAKRSELAENGAALQLPSTRSKNAEGRTVWLSEPAQRIIAGLPNHGPESYLFSFTGKAPYTAWSGGKARLDQTATRIAGRELPEWRLHDLRRTVATGMQSLGERLETIEAVLGHVSGSRAGIVGVYQRHRFEKEARVALDVWSRRVHQLLELKPANA